MKKEIIAGALLVIVFALTLINVHFLGKITSGLADMVSEAEASAFEGDWKSAAETAEKAADRWSSYDPYTHITVRHSEIDGTSDSFYSFLGAVYAEDEAAVKSGAIELRHKLESIHSMEKLTFGSIF